MYQPELIKAGLRGLVGFYPSEDPAYPSIDSALRTSLSGMYVDHKLITVENMYNVCPEFSNFTYPAWATGSDYVIFDVVTHSSITYRAKDDITNSTVSPNTDTANWEVIDAFSAWLLRKYDDACINLVNNFVTYKKFHRIGKSLLEMQELYRGPGQTTSLIIKHGRFVGYQIDITNSLGLMMSINKVGFQCTATQAELNFYLYNSSTTEPVVFPVAITKVGGFDWKTLTSAVIGYMRENYDSQSSYFIGYYEDDLVGQAIQKDFDISRAPCMTCDDYNINQYDKWSKYTGIRAMYVNADYLQPDNSLFDLSQVQYIYNTNWGMNLSISVQCDITPVLLDNKLLFASVLAKQISLDLLNEIAFTTRIGTIAAETKRLAMAELDPRSKSGSYMSLYMQDLESMIVDFSGFNRACFPLEDKNYRLSYRAI